MDLRTARSKPTELRIYEPDQNILKLRIENVESGSSQVSDNANTSYSKNRELRRSSWKVSDSSIAKFLKSGEKVVIQE